MDWYDLCKKYKVLDWIDDNILWYVWEKPKSAFKTIRYWFYCNWNKEHYRLVKRAFTSYPWDYFYMYELMECQIDKQIRWFEKHKLVENSDTDILRPLKWAKQCIHAMNNESELYEYDHNKSENKKTYTGPKINYRNEERFYKEFKSDFRATPTIENLKKYYRDYPEEYYILKCRKILFDILKQYSYRWWD